MFASKPEIARDSSDFGGAKKRCCARKIHCSQYSCLHGAFPYPRRSEDPRQTSFRRNIFSLSGRLVDTRTQR